MLRHSLMCNLLELLSAAWVPAAGWRQYVTHQQGCTSKLPSWCFSLQRCNDLLSGSMRIFV